MSALPAPAAPERCEVKARDAASPFDDARADIVLRSSDEVYFRVSKFILAIASPIFADMFSLSQHLEAEAVDEAYDGLPVVPMAEDAATLDLLLRWCYPIRPPKLVTLEDVRRLAEVSQKYVIDAFVDAIDDALRARLVDDPVGVFAVASTYNHDEIARAAARAALRVPLPIVAASPAAKLSSSALNTLVQYHIACGVAASAVASRRDFFLDASGLTKQFYSPCNSCFIFDYSMPPEHRNWYAPVYLWRYLDSAGRLLLLRPHEDAVRSECAVEFCASCANVGFQRMESTQQFVERFFAFFSHPPPLLLTRPHSSLAMDSFLQYFFPAAPVEEAPSATPVEAETGGSGSSGGCVVA
ncbi:hypothetical protein FA95DRAFT_1679821 [Auriscalpium vulgare]|uniref:Uncharacterized protein n=1 Tax=Auriscalpium vulgare TaxID=40419 RepID=A0ACB8RR32_9AGAM|nr:hypothetical protein FA95DRAFT_1679821 [Auriscalpium vulgare]